MAVRVINYPGPPTSGQGELLDVVVDSASAVWLCTAGGVPGTWQEGAAGGGAVTSVFSRTGVVTAQSGDYTAAQVGADASGAAATAQANALAATASAQSLANFYLAAQGVL